VNPERFKEYVQQTRLQAEQSFRLSKRAAVAGLDLIVVGIALGIVSTFVTDAPLSAAYLSAVSGIVSEFISGVFFSLFNRTLQQLNRFHDKLLSSQHIAMSLHATSILTDEDSRTKSVAELAAMLITTVQQNQSAAAAG
jgi:hypothetical protein